jgi:hypothetical protein
VTSDQNSVTSYTYYGLGDRLQEITVDLNTGLTQALSDGAHETLYGHTRLAQLDTDTLDTEYFLTDALGNANHSRQTETPTPAYLAVVAGKLGLSPRDGSAASWGHRMVRIARIFRANS